MEYRIEYPRNFEYDSVYSKTVRLSPKCETDEIDKKDKVQHISSTSFIISITQMFFLSGYDMFNIIISFHLCLCSC